ncbi:MAG: peptide chain release factor N(5)-glutamine methyltransferase [Bifidobacteriaceae bacterium]|jgi:release factor glutamine methyltransferase|nr:peptide chain release factor N(5)-glutamine methyltransferase [Bifidobacteriaceae bacterium]
MNFIYKLPPNERRLIFSKVLGFSYPETLKLEILIKNNLFEKSLFKNGLSLKTIYNKKRIEQIAKRRLAGKPLQYILKEIEFLNLRLKMKPGVFIPRMETEYMIECFLKDIKINRYRNLQILDICSGSGAIALSLAKHFGQLKHRENNELFNYKIFGFENSRKAINLSNRNKKLLNLDNVKFVKYNFPKALKKILDKRISRIIYQSDCIISNPPYIPDNFQAVDLIDKEVLNYEPHKALFAGPDGCDLAKSIIYQASLGKCKILYIECYESAVNILVDFAKKKVPVKFKTIQIVKDLAQKNRFLVCKK